MAKINKAAVVRTTLFKIKELNKLYVTAVFSSDLHAMARYERRIKELHAEWCKLTNNHISVIPDY